MSRVWGFFVLLVTSHLAFAGDWPQWLGPNRNGVSSENVTPWKGNPRVLWRQPVGEGHSSPVVANGRLFLHARVHDKDEEEIVGLDANTGKLLWRVSYPRAPFSSLFGNGPRATPSIEGDRVYALGVTGVLSCFKAESGHLVWQVDTLAKFKAPNLTFGVSCSPLVVDNMVLINVGGKGASIVAFDKDNGEVIWKALDDKASYSSPILVGKGKERQIIFVTQEGVVGLNPADGTVLWKYPMVDLLNESSTTPVQVGDSLVAGSVTLGSVGLRMEMKEGKPTVTKDWTNPNLTCYFSTPMPVGRDSLYMVTGTYIPPPQATLRCVDPKTGKERWHKDRIGKYHAAMIRTANDKLLLLEDGGDLALLEPSPKEYKELARSSVSGESWAHPALANGRLYIRDDKEVICLQLEGNPN